MKINTLCQQVYKALENANIYPEYVDAHENSIDVEISWGDWKHEHARADFILWDLGLVCTAVVVTEDDGSDCYSAVHRYEMAV